MVALAAFLRSGQDGALISGEPGDVLTVQADGRVKAETPSAPAAVQHAAVSLNFNHASSATPVRFAGVAVSGILLGDLVWCSTSGPTDTLGVLGGVLACYVVDDGQVDIIGELFSLDEIPTSVQQPVTVFWVTP
jgi:hypothetical protein